MDNFQIESAQNVTIQQNVAMILDRVLAFLVDALIILAFEIIAAIMVSALQLDMGETWMIYLFFGLPPFLYHLLFETFWNGQSLGKAALRIRVVKLDGSTPAFSNYLVRWMLRFVDISITSGSVAVVTILLNGKGQRLGDIAAGTTVISEKKQVHFQDMLMVDIPEGYQPKYPQVRVFSDADIQRIKNLYYDARRKANHNVIVSLSEKVAGLMEVVPEENPLKFLEIVIADYNFYTQQ